MPVRTKSRLKNEQNSLPTAAGPEADHRNHIADGAAQLAAVHRVTGGVTRPPMLCRLITKSELRQIVPYTGQHILRLEKNGKFPRRIRVGANRVAWLLTEVEAWVAARVGERDHDIR